MLSSDLLLQQCIQSSPSQCYAYEHPLRRNHHCRLSPLSAAEADTAEGVQGVPQGELPALSSSSGHLRLMRYTAWVAYTGEGIAHLGTGGFEHECHYCVFCIGGICG